MGRDEVPYFPPGVFDEEDKENDARVARDYAKHLRKMGEPSMWKLAKDDHAASVYRLLWVPSFHHSISVRIVKSGGSFAVHAVELDQKNDLEPGKIAIKKGVTVTEDQWTWLQVYLDRSRFWKMPSSVKMSLETGLILDGDSLVFEGAEDGRYHVVERADADRNYEKLCWFMLRLSGLKVREAWVDYPGDDVINEIDE